MPTTIKAALKKWEEASGKKSSEAKVKKIYTLLTDFLEINIFLPYKRILNYH